MTPPVNLESLLSPVSEESPCGADLSYDDRFFEIENAAKGKPATFLGEQEIPGEPPDWKTVRSGCESLLDESRDVRLVVMHAKAGLAMSGFPAFHESLTLLASLLDTFWEALHPMLDPDDPDPIERTNAIADLASRESGGGLAVLYEAPLTGATNFGQYSLRDYEIATGVREAPSNMEPDELPDLGGFNAAMEATDLDDLTSAKEAIAGAIAETKRIESVIRDKSIGMVQLDPLRKALESAAAIVEENIQARGGGGEEGDAGAGGGGGGMAAAGGSAAALPASVSSREQAMKAMDLAIAYFERYEPSHPAPLLLSRAKALINRPFLDVIDELFKLTDLGEQVRQQLGIPPVEDED